MCVFFPNVSCFFSLCIGRQFLAGYIMFASAAILSFVGGQLVDSIVNTQLGWAVDWITFLFVMVNFGFVGVIGIFYQKV